MRDSWLLYSLNFIISPLPLTRSSNEIIGNSSGYQWLRLPRGRIELLEQVLHVIIDFQNGRLITTTITVIGSREDCNHILIMRPVVTLER